MKSFNGKTHNELIAANGIKEVILKISEFLDFCTFKW
jgi:hypothetical protein